MMKDRETEDGEHITEQITLRPATNADHDFLLRVYACSRELEMSMVPWDDATKRAFLEHQFEAQTSYYRSEYPTARHDIITLTETGEQAGRIYVSRSDAQISIHDITVLPEYRHRGIGSAVLGALLGEARTSGQTIHIYVETFNPSQTFFAARGFTVENNDGLNLKLVWSPNKNG